MVISNGEVARAEAVVVQPDGAVVVGGRTASCSRVRIDHSLFRLTPTGAMDPTFSYDPPFFEVGGDAVTDVALQDDGRLVVLIDTFVGPATSPSRDDAWVVVRVNRDGTVDPTFDGDGVAILAFGAGTNATAAAVVVQPDGKIVLAGSVRSGSGGGGAASDFALARLDSDGTPDATFGQEGRVLTDVGGNDVLSRPDPAARRQGRRSQQLRCRRGAGPLPARRRSHPTGRGGGRGSGEGDAVASRQRGRSAAWPSPDGSPAGRSS